MGAGPGPRDLWATSWVCGPREAGCPPPPMQSRPPRCPLIPAPLSHSPLCLPLSRGISSLETPGPSALPKPNPNPDHRPTLSLDSRPYLAPQAPCTSPGPDPTWTETGPAAWSRPPSQMALAHLSYTGPSSPAPGLPSSSRPLGPSGCAGRTQCWGCPRLTQPRCSGLGQTCVPAHVCSRVCEWWLACQLGTAPQANCGVRL